MNSEDIPKIVKIRIEQAEESLADAKALLLAGGGGRSIVNRSYYSMFYCVMALLQTINRAPRKHQGAISIFDREFIHKGTLPRELSADLHDAFAARQVDDYQRLDPVGMDEAMSSIDSADRFLAAIKKYLTGAGFLKETGNGEPPGE